MWHLRQMIPCSVLEYNWQQGWWTSSGPLRSQYTVVCLSLWPVSEGHVWLFACVVTWYLKQGRDRKPQKPQCLPSFLFPLLLRLPGGRAQCCSHSSASHTHSSLFFPPLSLWRDLFFTTDLFIKYQDLFSSICSMSSVSRHLYLRQLSISYEML